MDPDTLRQTSPISKLFTLFTVVSGSLLSEGCKTVFIVFTLTSLSDYTLILFELFLALVQRVYSTLSHSFILSI